MARSGNFSTHTPIPYKRREAWNLQGLDLYKTVWTKQLGLLFGVMASKGETWEGSEFIWHATTGVFSSYTVPEPARYGVFRWHLLPEVCKNQTVQLVRLPGYNRGGKQQLELWENVHTELSFLPFCPNLLRVFPINDFDFPFADLQDWENPMIRCYRRQALHLIFA